MLIGLFNVLVIGERGLVIGYLLTNHQLTS